MTIHIMSNPHSFVNEAGEEGITYETLLEAIECIGQLGVARMFNGKSARGGTENTLAGGTIQKWMLTFEWVNDPKNKDIEDSDPYQARSISKIDNLWDDYVKLIKAPIPDNIVDSWKNLSKRKLGDEAIKYGITIGVRNTNSVKTLLPRMLKMIERRKKNLWNKDVTNKPFVTNYKLMNIFKLKNIAKKRKITTLHLLKDQIINLLKEYDDKISQGIYPLLDTNIDIYEDMTVKELKRLASNRKLTQYNNLYKQDLVKLHQKYDNDIKLMNNEIDENELENIEENTEINKDELVNKENIEENALELLCKENNKDELVNEENIEENEIQSNHVQEYNSNDNSCSDILLDTIFKYKDQPIRTCGTRDNPWFVAIDICKILGTGNISMTLLKLKNEWKGIKKINTSKGIQELIIINEAGLYKLIMRSNKPYAEQFQEWIFEEVLPSIRKTGQYQMDDKYKFILQNNRPLSQVMNLTDIDKEAEQLEIVYLQTYDRALHSNCFSLYIAYIGNGLVKIGSSDCNLIKREDKHTNSESEYPQFKLLQSFKISNRNIELLTHKFLKEYRSIYNRQIEVFRPLGSLESFITLIKNFLIENDTKLQLELAKNKIYELENNMKSQLGLEKDKIHKLEIEVLKLKCKLGLQSD